MNSAMINNLHEDRIFSTTGRAVNRANQTLARLMTTDVFDERKYKSLPRFHRHELRVGEMIGVGGFSSIYEIKGIDMRYQFKGDESQSRRFRGDGFIDEHNDVKSIKDPKYGEDKEETDENGTSLPHDFFRKDGIKSQFVMKLLRNDLILDAPKKYRQGAADLITETVLLSSLDHPNIIKISGRSVCGPEGFASNPSGEQYFIILERVRHTLDSQIDMWKHNIEKMNKIKIIFLDPHGTRRKALLLHRLKVALDLTLAMAYLHEKNIIYRDLKPDNIGISFNGKVKLLDFGLATELSPSAKRLDDTYAMSGETGSPRYMAPEVARREPYNLSADVYSFSILLWQLCSLQVPFERWTFSNYTGLVVRGNVRLPLNKTWPCSIKNLLKKSWSGDIRERPTFNEIVEILQIEVDCLGASRTGILKRIGQQDRDHAREALAA